VRNTLRKESRHLDFEGLGWDEFGLDLRFMIWIEYWSHGQNQDPSYGMGRHGVQKSDTKVVGEAL